MDEEECEPNSIEVLMEQTKQYIQQVLGMIDHIKNAKEPEDRLEIAANLSYSLNAMMLSIKGWGSWLNNIMMLATMSKEELESSYKTIRQIAIEFLKVDASITENKLIEARTKLDKIGKKVKPSKKDKTEYVT